MWDMHGAYKARADVELVGSTGGRGAVFDARGRA